MQFSLQLVLQRLKKSPLQDTGYMLQSQAATCNGFKKSRRSLQEVESSSTTSVKLRLHDAIYRLRFYSNSLIHILSLSNLHNNVAPIQKNRAINRTV